MIRVNYPMSPLAQLRLRVELATRRTRRALEERRRFLRAEAASRRSQQDAQLRLRWRQELFCERDWYEDFANQYEVLVGLLCVAAQEGVTQAREQRYQACRAWFNSHYAELKPMLGAYLEADGGDTIPGRWGRRACDGFEALFTSATLRAALVTDNGNLINRLMRTQTALGRWDDAIARREKASVDQSV